jgi:hypothetical protein
MACPERTPSGGRPVKSWQVHSMVAIPMLLNSVDALLSLSFSGSILVNSELWSLWRAWA